MGAVTVTTDNFQSEVLDSEQVVLTDFWAEWCGPCKQMEPVVEKLAEDYDGKLKVGKIDVDNQGELAARFNVMSIPTFLVFKKGEVVGQAVGAVPPGCVADDRAGCTATASIGAVPSRVGPGGSAAEDIIDKQAFNFLRQLFIFSALVGYL